MGIEYRGNALLLGGHDDAGPVRMVEQFDALTGQLTDIGASSPRDNAVQAVLGVPALRALVIGGSTAQGGVNAIDMVFGRQPEQQLSPDMGRVGLTATKLISGDVLVIGGSPPGGTPGR